MPTRQSEGDLGPVALTGPAREHAIPTRGQTAGADDRSQTVAKGATRRLLSGLSVLAGLLIWQILAQFFVKNALFLATPVQAAAAIGHLWQSHELQRHILVSGEEFLIGFALASAAGILVGLGTASFPPVSAVLGPWISGLYATPIVALAPLVILWFGIGIWSKIAVVISLVIFPVIINTDAGIRATDPQLIEVIRSFGARQTQIFCKVSLPSAFPFIMAGLRLGIGRGLIGVVVGELFGARAGLGFLINDAAQVFNMPALFAGVIVLAAAGIALTGGFQLLERYLVPWREE